MTPRIAHSNMFALLRMTKLGFLGGEVSGRRQGGWNIQAPALRALQVWAE